MRSHPHAAPSLVSGVRLPRAHACMLPMGRLCTALVLVAATSGTGVALATVLDPRVPLRVAGRVHTMLVGGDHVGDAAVVLQGGPSDGGVAALANVLRQHGDSTPLARLVDLTRAIRIGTPLGALGIVAAGLGHRVTTVRLPARTMPPALLRDHLPLVARVDGHRFVAVTALRPDGQVVVLDPRAGAYALPLAALRRRWSGEAVVVR